MEFEQILQLIDHVSASRLEGFCYESENLKLTLNNKLAACNFARNDRTDKPEYDAESSTDNIK